MRSKTEIWSKFGAAYQLAGGDETSASKSKYCKYSACDEPVIAASSGRLRDNWDKCEKRLRTIVQLDVGFRPSRKVAKKQGLEQGTNLGCLPVGQETSRTRRTASCLQYRCDRTWNARAFYLLSYRYTSSYY
jgi:hypothetical protein